MTDELRDWRASFPVLVAECQSIGSLAAVRSLGRAGYVVHAVSEEGNALGMRSRFASHACTHPAYTSGEFFGWLDDYIRAQGIRLIIPSEGFLRAIQSAFSRYSHLLPLPAEVGRVYGALSKYELFERFTGRADPHVPPTCLINSVSIRVGGELARLRLPLFLKADADTSRSLGALVERVAAASDLHNRAAQLQGIYGRLIAQESVPGVGVGVFFCRWHNEELAWFMHRRLHEVPYEGGVSSLRESWVHPEILKHARGVIEELDWDGVAMLEYRFDEQSGGFWLLEMNARFWGSLHLALYSGIDFPLILADAFHGRVARCTEFPTGIRCRITVPLEIQHVWSMLRDPGLGLAVKVGAIAGFVALGLSPTVKEDLLFPGDRWLYVVNMGRFARAWLGACLRSAWRGLAK
jgi:predicted ATP-grasp superfamily ATP-dependent carboligase